MSEVIRIPLTTLSHYEVLQDACKLAGESITSEIKRISASQDWVKMSQSNSLEIQQFGILLQDLGKQLEYFNSVNGKFPKTIARGNYIYLQVTRAEVPYLDVALNHALHCSNLDVDHSIVMELQGILFAAQFYMTNKIIHDTGLDSDSHWEQKRARQRLALSEKEE